MDQPTSLNQSLAIPFIIAGLTLFLLISFKLLLFPRTSYPGKRSELDKDVKVVISGPMGNGKTYLWSRLVYGTNNIETVTSMVENEITVNFQSQLISYEKHVRNSKGSPVCLIDTPGHPRLRCRSLARNLPDARAVIFVIDSQLGLSGKGLRDTSGVLELVLSLLQLHHHQKPYSPLPKLLIYLSNPGRNGNSSGSLSGLPAIIEKTRACLTKDLNRRKLNSTGPSSSGVGLRKSRLESLEAIPSSELNSFFDIIKRFLKFGRPPSVIGEDRNDPSQLPEEESEVMKLLEEEEDNLATDHKRLDLLDRYEKLSGHPLHWIVSGEENGNEVNALKSWLIGLSI